VKEVPREAVLSIRNLHREFLERPRVGHVRRIQALRGVDLDVHSGECLALVGESGCGKTTLARVVLRLLEATRGSVLFQGRDVFGFGPRELMAYRRRVQIVFQDPYGSLNPRLRAGQMLEEVLKVHQKHLSKGDRRGRVVELLRLVGMRPEAAFRYPHEFSGGQRQRLGIARALSVGPEVLVLDEPVSALDLSVQAQILNLLTELQGALGLTYLFITHDLSVVRQVADRVGVLYLGEVVEVGPAQEIFAEPLHPYTRSLLMAARAQEEPSIERSPWAILPGEPPSPAAPPVGCVFHPRCPHPAKGSQCTAAPPSRRPWDDRREVACWKVWEHLAGT
jgi:oligopeptide/dipeptide ABC transporter ATP-binding protein